MKRDKQRADRRNIKLQLSFKEYPEMMLTENQYKAMRYTLVQIAPHLKEKLTPEQLLWLCEEIPAIQREWRRQTEEIQKEEKERLAQQYQINHGYAPNHYQSIKKLNTLN